MLRVYILLRETLDGVRECCLGELIAHFLVLPILIPEHGLIANSSSETNRHT